MKKFLITESCLYRQGQHAEAGETLMLTPREAAELQQAGRGYAVPDAPPRAEAATEESSATPVKPDVPPTKSKK